MLQVITKIQASLLMLPKLSEGAAIIRERSLTQVRISDYARFI
jgi:hypothetical protein